MKLLTGITIVTIHQDSKKLLDLTYISNVLNCRKYVVRLNSHVPIAKEVHTIPLTHTHRGLQRIHTVIPEQILHDF